MVTLKGLRFYIFVLGIMLVIPITVFADTPWLTNQPIVSVNREIYIPQSVPHVAPGSQMFVLEPNGANTRRMEYLFDQSASDIGSNVTIRFSDDNGRSWSTPINDVPSGVFVSTPSGSSPASMLLTESTGNAMPIYDPTSGLLITSYYRAFSYQSSGSTTSHSYCRSYYRTSADRGLTWSPPIEMNYESGTSYTGTLIMNMSAAELADGDVDNSSLLGNLFTSVSTGGNFNALATYRTNNNSYPAQKFVINSQGQLVIGMGGISLRPNGQDNDGSPGDPLQNRYGAMNMVGTWNPTTQTYSWQASDKASISTTLSARGIFEPDTVALKDGRILTTFRGANNDLTGTAAQNAGHKWLTIADNGGLNIVGNTTAGTGGVFELKYDDGTSFYSPGSYHRTFRLEGNGKLYWLGNITDAVPSANGPRTQLMIAEINEDLAVPALIKDSVTLVATQMPGELSSVQYSNFSVLENPETHQIELYLSNIGKLGSGSSVVNGFNVFDGDALRFTLTFPGVIPEPSTYAVMLCGCIAVLLKWRRHHR